MRFVLLLITFTLAQAQFVPGRYIVELAESTSVSKDALDSKSGKERTAAIEDRRNRLLAEKGRLRAAIQSVGATVLDSTEVVSNTITIRADESVIPQILANPQVVRVRKVRVFKPNLNRAAGLLGVPAVWNRIGPDKAGAGIKIAIIDSGIDAQHPGFQDSSLVAPDGYPRVNQMSDASFTNSKVIVARSYADFFVRPDPDTSARDRVGHGTALAMAAAGTANTGPLATISGMAPKAFLGSYKVFGTPGVNDTATDDALLKAIEDAVSDGMDVINLSLGSLLAARPEDDILVRALDRAEELGVITVVAAGNDGPEPNTISSPATALSAIAAGASTNDRVFASALIVTGRGAYSMLPGESSSSQDSVTGLLLDVSGLDQNGLACSALPTGSLSNRIALILRGVCTFEEKLNNAQAAGAIAAVVYTDRERPQAITMSVGIATLPAAMVSFAGGDQLHAALINGQNLESTLHFRPIEIASDPSFMAEFSSTGPGAGNSVKPDLVAVGTSIYTATQSYDANSGMYSPLGYIQVQGTSFSAPLVAGAAALLKSVKPGFAPKEYRSLLVNSAQPFPADNSAVVQKSGSGRLDVDLATRNTLALQPVSLSFGVDVSGGTARRELTMRNLGTTPETFEVNVVARNGAARATPSQNAVYLNPGQSATIAVNLDVPIAATGVSDGFLMFRKTSDDIVTRVPYWSAVRSQDPSSILILHAADSAGTGRTLSDLLLFRVLDKSGVALKDMQPTVTVVRGLASATNVHSIDDEVADAFSVDVQLGFGQNVIRIDAGSVSKEVTLTGR